MWLGNSLLRSAAVFFASALAISSFFDTKNTACRGYKPCVTQMGLVYLLGKQAEC
jgi:hypothetical protein